MKKRKNERRFVIITMSENNRKIYDNYLSEKKFKPQRTSGSSGHKETRVAATKVSGHKGGSRQYLNDNKSVAITKIKVFKPSRKEKQ